jgi:endonuclease YncB( thermonuclease family)
MSLILIILIKMTLLEFYKKIKLKWKNADNVSFFNFVDHIKIAKVVDVYDGDTITIITDVHGTYYKFKVRLFGIDCPELKPSKDIDNRDLHIKSANKVKDILTMLILNRTVKLLCKNFDKYGRLLVVVIFEDININDFLLENKLAKKYDGKTKVDFRRESLDIINNYKLD